MVVVGTILLKIGSNPNAALLHFDKAVKLLGYENPVMTGNYIEALRQHGAYDRANDLITQLVSLPIYKPSPSTSLFYYNVAMLEISLGSNRQRAIGFLEQSLLHDPNNINGWRHLIELYINTANFEKAEQQALVVLKAVPNDDRLWYLLGIAVHHLKRFEEAVQHYSHSLELNPEHFAVYANLGAAYQGLGKVEEAAACYRKALPHLPTDAGKDTCFYLFLL